MTATLLEGKPLAKEIEAEVIEEVEGLKAEGITPNLTVVLVGDDPASKVYVGSKERACKRVGIDSTTLRLPASLSERDLLNLVGDLNSNPAVHGILVQLPLPSGIDPNAVLCAVDPAKDVDGFVPENMGKLLLGFPYTVACTPAGIARMLDHYEVPLEGADVVIIGRSNIVGKPLAALLVQKTKGRNCTVTICHSRTADIPRHTRNADVVVAALGSPKFLKADMVRAGCTVVDVGINRVEDRSAKRGYRLVGDADFQAIVEKAAYITPVPGGVGPLTVGILMKNTLKVARCCGCKA
jgi:methylenetetrahydrofolate dehydrogenase (NADP+)/methenyltetrahydrofolate cyclohydrolase